MIDARLYEVLSPTKIKLGPEAKYWAEQNGMTLAEMAKHLLHQHYNGDQVSDGASEDILPHVTPSENVEDRRDESFVPDKTMQQIWGAYPYAAAPHAQTFGPNPLANALGFGDVGKSPAPGVPVIGPTAPQWPAAFQGYRPLPDENEGTTQ
jgi:hypothetical protein